MNKLNLKVSPKPNDKQINSPNEHIFDESKIAPLRMKDTQEILKELFPDKNDMWITYSAIVNDECRYEDDLDK